MFLKVYVDVATKQKRVYTIALPRKLVLESKYDLKPSPTFY